MRDILHFTSADARRVAWKNGRGFTQEVAVWPPGAKFERGDFDWRISKASVPEPGPFSAFPGFDRVLVVTGGEGLVLDHGADAPRAEVGRLAPYRFSGDWPTSAHLRGGPVEDFNLLVRRGRGRGDVRAVRIDRDPVSVDLRPGHAVLHVLRGNVDVCVTRDGRSRPLGPGDSLWVRDAGAGDRLDLTRGAATCEALLAWIAPS